VTSSTSPDEVAIADITSVFIGYIGTDSIGSLIKRFAAKKAGVEDGRNQ
jgi:lambda family phage holin